MEFQVDVVLRGEEHATTRVVTGVAREPAGWTEGDVAAVLRAMLAEIDRVKNPNGPEPSVSLRGFSWIVEPFEGGGVVIALEIPSGAAVAGPFLIAQAELDDLITRAVAGDRAPGVKLIT